MTNSIIGSVTLQVNRITTTGKLSLQYNRKSQESFRRSRIKPQQGK